MSPSAARVALESVMATRGERDSHPGLLLQRYLQNWAAGDRGDPAEKRAVIESALRSARQEEIRSLYKTAFERWKASLPELTAANDLQTVGRLIVGLGTENVLETGITLHHTYGMPVLPGSALKGLAAHYCHTVWGETEAKFKRESQYHTLLFGTTDESGCIIFHDGWFVPDSEKEPLKLDVMTPHHPKWLDGSVPPTDFDSPTPVPFLSVAGRFRIALSWHGPASDQSSKWLELAQSLLHEALREWGIGGKTTSGYGRLDAPPPPPPPSVYKGKAGNRVQAVLLEEKTKKGGWKAQIKGHLQTGPIQNTAEVPSEHKPGDEVQLILASIKDKEAAFKWPSVAKK